MAKEKEEEVIQTVDVAEKFKQAIVLPDGQQTDLVGLLVYIGNKLLKIEKAVS